MTILTFGLSKPFLNFHRFYPYLPGEAKKFGAKIVATGRPDFPNQVNNQLAFPGFMRGLLNSRKRKIDNSLMLKAAYAIANHVKKSRSGKIVPTSFDKSLRKVVSKSVEK